MEQRQDKDNYCVIMAGGVGSRFWPMSTNACPKQFLDPLGMGRSFIRSTFERFLPIVPVENFLVVTSHAYLGLVLEHLPELSAHQVLLEPLRRNTAPCIAYATHRIAAINAQANIVVTPSDHLVTNESEFQRIIQRGLSFVHGNDKLLTIGITPTRAETGYGYIQFEPCAQCGGVNKVRAFTEKPNVELARTFVESGDFLWNSGIFIWSVGGINAAFDQHLPEMNARFAAGKELYATPAEQSFIDELYPNCHNISIDYGIMEKSENVYVCEGDFGWSDIGTWGSLFGFADKDHNGNTCGDGDVLMYDTSNTLVGIPRGKLAVVQGLDGYLVIDRGDRLLICKMDDEQNIRNWVEDVKLKYGAQFI